METKHKNLIIGGLLAIVLVMAVGYAAFATQLNINGTANITSSWNVHFDSSKTTGAGVIDATTGLTGAQAPTGTVAYADENLTANLTANLTQPGDKIVYTLTILNEGSLDAKAATPVVKLDNGTTGVNGLTATKGHIKFTVTEPTPNPIVAETGVATMTVTAEYIDTDADNAVTGNTTTTESAELGVTITYTQDTTSEATGE